MRKPIPTCHYLPYFHLLVLILILIAGIIITYLICRTIILCKKITSEKEEHQSRTQKAQSYSDTSSCLFSNDKIRIIKKEADGKEKYYNLTIKK